MSADLLRRAAAVLRERAEAASTDVSGSWDGIGTGYRDDIHAYIATMRPDVGLALADWLDRFADLDGDLLNRYPDRFEGHPALAVARAVLGETP